MIKVWTDKSPKNSELLLWMFVGEYIMESNMRGMCVSVIHKVCYV